MFTFAQIAGMNGRPLKRREFVHTVVVKRERQFKKSRG